MYTYVKILLQTAIGVHRDRLQTCFVSSLDLLLHRSNVRTLSKPPVLSGELPKRGIERQFSNVIDASARPPTREVGRSAICSEYSRMMKEYSYQV